MGVSVGLLVGLLTFSQTSGTTGRPAPATAASSLDPAARTQILVLGTPHLSTLEKPLNPKALDSLLDVLVAFRPRVVAVEAMPAWSVSDMDRRKGHFTAILEQFAAQRLAIGRIAQAETKLSAEAAQVESRRLLEALSRDSESRERVRAILVCLAGYEETCALLQWSYLPETVRADTDLLPISIRTHLSKSLAGTNEISAIGVRVASQLGLSSISDIDDQREGDRLLDFAPALTKELESNPAYRAVADSTTYRESDRRFRESAEKNDLLPYYLWLNAVEYQRADLETQWGLFFRTRLPSGLDRARVALWEVRNLLMVANIREASAGHPGGRVLVVVGVAHKPFLDAYLSQMTDVALVDLKDIASKGTNR